MGTRYVIYCPFEGSKPVPNNVWPLVRVAQENPPLSQKEAWLFPVMGSCVLFSLYLAFKFLGKEFVNLLLGLYFAVIGLVLLQQTLSPVVGLVLSSVSLAPRACGVVFSP